MPAQPQSVLRWLDIGGNWLGTTTISIALLIGLCGAGIVLGWLIGARHVISTVRRQSLVLIDERRPDMPLEAGVRHVRLFSRQVLSDDREAIAAIIDAAKLGRLSLWQPSLPNTMRRMTRKQLGLLASDAVHVSTPPRSVGARINTSRLCLLRDEVERIWPRDQTREITLRPVRH